MRGVLHKNAEVTGSATLCDPEQLDKELLNLSEEVELVVGDQYADSQGVKAIDYLKIDVEDWEMPVLQGFRVLLENHCIRCIQFEVTPNTLARGDNFADFFDLFSPLDYSIHAIQLTVS